MSHLDTLEIGAAELAEARQYSMRIAWSPEDDAYVVSVPELPGLHTHGASVAEAATMGEEAIATWLAGLRSRERSIPPPPKTARRSTIERPPAYDAVRIRKLRKKLNISQPVLAAALNVSPATVKSWEQGVRQPTGPSLRLLAIAEEHPDVIVKVSNRSRVRIRRLDDAATPLKRRSNRSAARTSRHPVAAATG